MELATLVLKLSGQTANTVVKHNVTPAQLACYAYMHGEDCVQSLTLTGIDKSRQPAAELNRLEAEFSSDRSHKAFKTLFPGRFPDLPVSFRKIGFDPEGMVDNTVAMTVRAPDPKGNTDKEIMEKIRQRAKEREAEEKDGIATVRPVTSNDRADLLDDTGGPEDDDDDEGESNTGGGLPPLALSDDPLENEILRNQKG